MTTTPKPKSRYDIRSAAMPETLSGSIERVTFHNLDSGYCVLRVAVKGHRDPVTVVGSLPACVAGEFVEASGDWVNDRTHGPQFKAEALRTMPPHTAAGLVKYLGSGFVKGIGPKYAAKIVEAFGENTLDVLDRSPAQLNGVKGIGAKRIELIRESWAQNRAIHGIFAFLQSYGLGTSRAARIYKTYGENAVEQVRQNPYRLSEDIWGVGFRTADELALKLGLPRDAPQRLKAALRHVLREGSNAGHVGLPSEVLLEQAIAHCQVPRQDLERELDQLRVLDEVIADAAPPGATADDPPGLVYLKSLYTAEVGVARSVRVLLDGVHPLPMVDGPKAVTWVEGRLGLTLAVKQREAIELALASKVLVITGGPGTGKTTILKAILDIFAAKRLRLGLCAPTGRAAKRMQESTGREAKTIHRLLEFDAAAGQFQRKSQQPLDVDVLVIDECSMLDISLAHQLLRAVPPWACVLFVGDRDQLPSVGPGAVLADLIASGVVPVVALDVVHRQAQASWIVRAAHAINAGEEPESAPVGQGDFYFVEADEPAAIIDKLLAMIGERIPVKFGFDKLRDIQVLAPMNKYELGVGNLNAVLQEALNPPEGNKAEIARFGTIFRIGDKVMQTRNSYQRDIYNGDLGRISGLDSIEQVMTVEFDGRKVQYEFGDLDELVLAYCTTIHKSQGSEYPAVVIPLHTQHFVMLQRHLLYTGVTRGRKLVVLVGSKKALYFAVNRSEQKKRFALLAARLRSGS